MVLVGLPELTSIAIVGLLLVPLKAGQGAWGFATCHVAAVDERRHLQAIHIVVAVQHRVALAGLGHGWGKFSASIPIVTGLVDFG